MHSFMENGSIWKDLLTIHLGVFIMAMIKINPSSHFENEIIINAADDLVHQCGSIQTRRRKKFKKQHLVQNQNHAMHFFTLSLSQQ